MLRRAFARRRSRRTRSRCGALRRLSRTIRFRTIVGLRRGRPIVPRGWLCRTIVRRRLIRLRTIRFRTIVGLHRGRPIVPRGWLCRTIVRRRLIRLRTIRFRTIVRLHRGRPIVPRGWLCRTIVRRRLIVRSGTVRLRRICPRTRVRRRRIARSVRISRLATRSCYGGRSGLSRRCLPHLRTRSRRGIIRGLQVLHLLPRYWLPWMCRQRLLSRRKGHRRRRRFRPCDHRATGHGSRGHCHSVRCIGMGSEHTVGGRRDRRP
jgi:hypothetical protein